MRAWIDRANGWWDGVDPTRRFLLFLVFLALPCSAGISLAPGLTMAYLAPLVLVRILGTCRAGLRPPLSGPHGERGGKGAKGIRAR